MKIFNQLDYKNKISNLEILENNIVNKNYGTNSVMVQLFNPKNEEVIEISFAKGKNTKNGLNSLFKIMQGYKKSSSKQNVYNIGIPINHYFWVRRYDINSGELVSKKLSHYYEMVDILELNNIFHLLLASKQKNENKTPEEMIIIKKRYEKFKKWYENEYKEKEEITQKEESNEVENEKTYDKNTGSSKVVIQDIFS